MARTNERVTDERVTDERVTGDVWTDPDCPVARALDLVGDKWSLLIVRDAMDGARTFTEFQTRTGIARNILTDRLRKLTALDLLDRRPAPSGRRQEYVLSESGRDLFVVVVALRQWGERHAFAPDEAHSVLVDCDGTPVPGLAAVGVDGTPLDDGTTFVRRPD